MDRKRRLPIQLYCVIVLTCRRRVSQVVRRVFSSGLEAWKQLCRVFEPWVSSRFQWMLQAPLPSTSTDSSVRPVSFFSDRRATRGSSATHQCVIVRSLSLSVLDVARVSLSHSHLLTRAPSKTMYLASFWTRRRFSMWPSQGLIAEIRGAAGGDERVEGSSKFPIFGEGVQILKMDQARLCGRPHFVDEAGTMYLGECGGNSGRLVVRGFGSEGIGTGGVSGMQHIAGWMMSRKVNLSKLGSRRQNRLLGGWFQ